MDPDKTLTELRAWAQWTLQSAEAFPTEVRAAECFDALDKWLSARGFLPDPWNWPR